jgi:hypothetical protein
LAKHAASAVYTEDGVLQSETLAIVCQTVRRLVPPDSNLESDRRPPVSLKLTMTTHSATRFTQTGLCGEGTFCFAKLIKISF